MSKAPTATGKCLCGSVKFEFSLEKEEFDACHCGMCRGWSGGPLMTVHAGGDISFTGKEFIKAYSSSDWAERGFCVNCGTHLFYHLKGKPFFAVPVGLLEKSSHFKFVTQIFVDRKPENYSFANKTEMMTEAEVFAKFGG